MNGTASTELLGHQHIIDTLLSNDARRHHGFIFQGPKGVGKASAAYRLAEFMMANSRNDGLFWDTLAATPVTPAEDDPDVNLLRAGTHPDVMVVEGDPGKANLAISVEQIRGVVPFLAHTPSRGGMRFVLIDAIDQMNVNGANALLKTLEEPPQNTILIIIHHGKVPVLPTIRSRAQLIKFNTLGFDETRQIIASLYPDADKNWIDAATVLSGGAPGKAMLFAEADAIDLYTETCSAFANGGLKGLEIDRLSSLWGAGGAKNTARRQLARQFFDRLLVKAVKRDADAVGRINQQNEWPEMDIEEQAVARISARVSAYHLTEIRQDMLAALYEAEKLNLDAGPIIFTTLAKMTETA